MTVALLGALDHTIDLETATEFYRITNDFLCKLTIKRRSALENLIQNGSASIPPSERAADAPRNA